MVKTELEYNPYLMEINVKFNGREPRVNSLIEKYKKSVLQDWMKELPEIFYNEMNGYDFELEFTGTVKDYEDLRNIFISNGVDDNLVHIIHKNELDARNEKMKQIRELIEWISNNDNKRFSFEKFSIKNDELLDGVYNFIIIQGRNVDTSYFSDKNMSFEYIEDITKLDDTELSNTPILICINNDSVSDLQKNIDYIMKRVEIKEKQIFFSIDTELIEKEIVRIIKDMGIEYPQLISSLDDEKILSYIWIYPITDYIKQFIKMAKYDFVKIRDEVETEKTAREESNKVIYEQLDKIEALIVCMKDVCDKIINRDNLNISDEWLKAKEHVCISLDRII